MTLAIFDLDNTLLAGDSDFLWGEFLVDKKRVDANYYREENQRFYDEYNQGNLDILAFLNFSLAPLGTYSKLTLDELHREFMHDIIEPLILPKAEALVEKHRQQGHTLMIITATNAFVTAPIAKRLHIPHLIATIPEMMNGEYTGKVSGTPSFQAGKVTRLDQWLNQHSSTLTGSYFYSDSHNDRPLLEKVTHPVAVDADSKLIEYATQHGWEMMSLR